MVGLIYSEVMVKDCEKVFFRQENAVKAEFSRAFFKLIATLGHVFQSGLKCAKPMIFFKASGLSPYLYENVTIHQKEIFLSIIFLTFPICRWLHPSM